MSTERRAKNDRKKDTPSVNNSIQTRLSGVMLMVLVFALGINFFIFSQIQNAVTRIDAVFSSNVDVNELSEALELVENTVYEYLNTKSTETLENYYRYDQNYKNLIEDLNDKNMDSEVKMLEKTSAGCPRVIWIRQMRQFRRSEEEM